MAFLGVCGIFLELLVMTFLFPVFPTFPLKKKAKNKKTEMASKHTTLAIFISKEFLSITLFCPSVSLSFIVNLIFFFI